MTVWRSGIKLGVFVVVSLALTLIVSNTVTRPLNAPTYTYRAQFTDASGLRPGDDVDIAGVRVGKVTGERLQGAHALISFEVERDQPMTTAVHAVIRYQDLLGARFLSLLQPAPSGTRLVPGATIPLTHTMPALSLTALFNGFKPLFSALSPQQANQLASAVIADFQGEGGGIVALLHNVAAVTDNLSNRDALIGRVIDNLDTVLGSVATHRGDLAALISQLETLTSGLSADRHQIGASLQGLDEVSRSVSGLVTHADPTLHHDIGDLYLLAGNLVHNDKRLDRAVKALPIGAAAFTRSLGYGSWLNGYVCSIALKSGSLLVPVTVGGTTVHSAVCR
jgi:phospholipid/cholesterol/gamma-HCH transport system substrate-binding protein